MANAPTTAKKEFSDQKHPFSKNLRSAAVGALRSTSWSIVGFSFDAFHSFCQTLSNNRINRLPSSAVIQIYPTLMPTATTTVTSKF